MKAAKIYSNKFLFDIYAKIIRRDEGAYNSDEVAEAIRIRKKNIDIANVVKLINISDNDLKAIKCAVRMAEEIAKTTDEVPNLCDL